MTTTDLIKHHLTRSPLIAVTVALTWFAIALGLIRIFASTTTSALCHVVYNALVGVGVAWAVLPAIGVEAALVAATLGTWFLTSKVGSASAAG